MLKVHYHETGVTITGDEAVLEKATKGTGSINPAVLDISDIRVDAHSLEVLFHRAESIGPIYYEVDGEQILVGYPHAKRYAAMREKFVKMIELAKAKPDDDPIANTPAITTQSIKPINE